MTTQYLGTGLLNVADVGLATGIAALRLAASVQAIRTGGYAANGPGAGSYVSDGLANAGLAAAHPRFCKQSADLRYWRLLPEPHISVKQAGAAGDGVADDHAAIQAAIDYALTLAGATVYFPAGTYKVLTSPEIVHGKGINLLGEGPDRSIIAAGAFPAMKTRGYWRSTVKGLGFWCNANPTGGAFELDGEPDGSFGVQQITFEQCFFFGTSNSKFAFTNQRVAGGSGQGSECLWLSCAFQGAGHNPGDALFLNNGNNALNNTLLGCNFQEFLTGVKIASGNIDVLHCGFQSIYGYEQITSDGWDVEGSSGTVGDRTIMIGCRSESLRIYRGGGNRATITGFTHQQRDAPLWTSGTKALNALAQGQTAAGNVKMYRVTTAGTTGGSEPAWPESGTVADGSTVWTQTNFNVFEGVNGRIADGQIQLGQFGCVNHSSNSLLVIEDVKVTRDDCFETNSFVSDFGPLLRNVRLGGAPPPGNADRPVIVGLNGNPGARNTHKVAHYMSGGALVWNEGLGGGSYHDLVIARGGGSITDTVPNWFEVTGGWGFAQVTFAQIMTISRAGVVYFVTDGTPGSSPLTGGGTGCLAVFQNGAWRSVSGSGGGAAGASGVTTVDFGAFPGTSDTAATITGQAGIVAGSRIRAWIEGTATADHSADEHWLETIAVIAGNVVPGTGFTIHAKNTGTLNEPVAGPWAGTRLAGPGAGLNQQRPDTGGGKGTRLTGAFTVGWEWN